MKSLLVSLLVCMAIICHANPKTVRLHGKMQSANLPEVVLRYDGASAFISDKGNVTIPLSKDGSFDIVFELEKPGYYSISRNPLYLTPGDDMEVYIDEDPRKSTFKGRGAEVNRYLSTRFYPKGGSYLESGKNCFPDFSKTQQAIDSIMAMRSTQLAALKCSKEFRTLEEMRIKGDMLQSIYYYITYNARNMFPPNCTKEEFNKISNDFLLSQKDAIEPALKELAASDKALDIEVVRYAVLVLNDKKLFNVQLSDRWNELTETYYIAAELNEQMTPELYQKVNDYMAKMKYEDFREALAWRLDRSSKLMEGRPAPDIDLKDINGKAVKLSDYKGKVLYVDFWATWCGPCRAETPFFNALCGKYPDIQFIAISIDEKEDLWANTVKQGDTGNVVELLSTDPDLRTKWDVAGIPRFLLIDKDFNIIKAVAPRPSQANEIDPLLKEWSNK